MKIIYGFISHPSLISHSLGKVLIWRELIKLCLLVRFLEGVMLRKMRHIILACMYRATDGLLQGFHCISYGKSMFGQGKLIDPTCWDKSSRAAKRIVPAREMNCPSTWDHIPSMNQTRLRHYLYTRISGKGESRPMCGQSAFQPLPMFVQEEHWYFPVFLHTPLKGRRRGNSMQATY